MKKYLLLVFLPFLLASCSKENAVSPEPPPANNYSKVLTVDTANYKIEMYNDNSSILYVGYNEIGFKVFVDNTEKKTGFLKYTPTMVHNVGHGHSTPVQSEFTYDDSKGMFTGYVCYSMLSDSTTSFWFADYNYNNEFSIVKKQFNVVLGVGNQMSIWLDTIPNPDILYYLTLISPKDPRVGLNDFKVILHQTTDNTVYNEVNEAQMFIRPWMPSHGHGSSSNINPVFTSHGKYEGKANLTMSGQWYVYDSIVVNNHTASSPSFYLVFDAK
jgi:hypothetical protein